MKVLNENIYLKYNKIFILGYTLCSIKLSCTFEVLNLKVAGPKILFPTPLTWLTRKTNWKRLKAKIAQKLPPKLRKRWRMSAQDNVNQMRILEHVFQSCLWNSEIWLKFRNLVEILEIVWNSEIWLRFWTLVKIQKFGQHSEMW